MNEKKKIITINTKETTHPKAPKDTGRVRMPFIRVKWMMKPLKKYQGKKTYIHFQVHADPGGLLPSWVVNMVSKKIPFKSIDNLRKHIAAGKVRKSFVDQYKQYENWY